MIHFDLRSICFKGVGEKPPTQSLSQYEGVDLAQETGRKVGSRRVEIYHKTPSEYDGATDM